MKIMVVEDDEIIAESVKMELKRWGYDVDCVDISECKIYHDDNEAELTKTEMLISESLFKAQGADYFL